MADKTINIRLRSQAKGDRFKKTQDGCAKTLKVSADLFVNAKKHAGSLPARIFLLGELGRLWIATYQYNDVHDKHERTQNTM